MALEKPGRYVALDGWRGICALMVAMFHLPVVGGYLTGNAVVQHAYLFVDFFFVLSGFILGTAWAERLGDRDQLPGFAIRRLGRLWPLHLTMLAALVGWEMVKLVVAPDAGQTAPFTEGRSIGSLLANLFLVQGWGFADQLSWNMPSWSISVEIAAYAVFALICAFARRHLILISAGIIILCLGWIALALRHMDATYHYGLQRGLAGFFLGIIVWTLPRANFEKNIGLALEIVTPLLAVAFVALCPRAPAQVLAPFFFAAVVWVFSAESGQISNWLKSRPMQALGTWSYSIYMVHAPTVIGLGVLTKVYQKLTGRSVMVPYLSNGTYVDVLNAPVWVQDAVAVAYVVLVLTIASLTYRWIETPGRLWGNRLADRLGKR